jgi:Fe-S cluster biogenesis protein NfuA/nitrite reductase/ring-hydroxylating ferredoxin subunit
MKSMEPHYLNDEEFRQTTTHLHMLIRQMETLPYPEVQEKVFEMLQALDRLHREGIWRLVNLLKLEGQTELIDRASEDEAIKTLLLLYDLLPGDPLLQVEKALDSIRPYLHTHGGEVEVLDVVDGVVHLSLVGSCQGCAGSDITLQRGIETVLREEFSGFKGIEVHEPPIQGRQAQGGLITFDEVASEAQPHVQPAAQAHAQPSGNRSLSAPVFKTVARLDSLPVGATLPVALENKNALLANVDGEIYAVGAQCPGSEYPLTFAKLEDAQITCPWHGEVFDVRSGKRMDDGQDPDRQRLPVYPVALQGNEVRIAVNVAPRPMRTDRGAEEKLG